MVGEVFHSILLLKYPIFEVKGVKMRSKYFGKGRSVLLLKQYFTGLKILQQLVDVGCRTLGGQKFSCRDVQKGNPLYFFPKVNGS